MRFALLSLLVASFSTAAVASFASNTPGIPGFPKTTDRPRPVTLLDIVIETFHRENKTLTNKTISMSMQEPYQNSSNLNAVTTLYSLGYYGISCFPLLGSGLRRYRPRTPYGMPFTVGHPSYLGHNDTVVVTRIVCTDTGFPHNGHEHGGGDHNDSSSGI
ncbi:hypothetical protein F4678DRAFT_425370 [Xylaria arbuscula]|nr:hypothetical protein F4678DRAFT_425370 [Xylaria arbuscula]